MIDVFKASSEELEKEFAGFDALIYAIGPDDRITPKAPAYEFFHFRLVKSCAKVIRAAKKAGVKKVAICNSYFGYFNTIWPEKQLAKKHPYIRCRVEQSKLCRDIGLKSLMRKWDVPINSLRLCQYF